MVGRLQTPQLQYPTTFGHYCQAMVSRKTRSLAVFFTIALLCLAGCALVPLPCRTRGLRNKPKTARQSQREAGTESHAPGKIFVSIAAFLDPELSETLRAMLMQAERPELLQVGIVWQGLEKPPFSHADLSELHELWQIPAENPAKAFPLENEALSALLERNQSFPHMPRGEDVKRATLCGGHIRLIDIQAKDARGCHWARYIAQLLWEGEEFYLQLDSHMRFTKHWDTQMREQLALCSQKSAKPVLSNYGRPYSLGTPASWTPSQDLLTPSHICAGRLASGTNQSVRFLVLVLSFCSKLSSS